MHTVPIASGISQHRENRPFVTIIQANCCEKENAPNRQIDHSMLELPLYLILDSCEEEGSYFTNVNNNL